MTSLKLSPGPGLVVMAWVVLVLANGPMIPVPAGFEASGQPVTGTVATSKPAPQSPCS